MGALYQFLPVALGASIRSERVAHVTLGGWILGLGAFVVGLAVGWRSAYLTGASLLGLSVILFAGNLAATLPRAERRGLTWWCVAGAGLALLGTWILGGLLALNLGTGFLGGDRFAVLAIHLHVAAGGWVLLTMIGVADHLLPMFLLSHGATRIPGRVAAVLVGLGTAGLLLTGHLLPAAAIWPFLGVLAAGALALLLQAGLFYRHRMRPELDPGLQLVAGALILLGLAVGLGSWALVAAAPGARLLTAYGVLLVPGGLGLFVAGHYYRIVPFLTWFHRYGPVAAERDVPRVSELFGHGTARGAAYSMIAGIALLTAGVLAGSVALCLGGAATFGLGAMLMSGQMLAISRRGPR